jgi:NAD(P)-dependent dehydrogenase (short-subunit alcohol dehydrogenase family)
MKTASVTGANCGIGIAAAQGLAGAGLRAADANRQS